MENQPIRWSRVLRVSAWSLAIVAVVILGLRLLLPRIVLWDLAPDYTMLWTGARFALERPDDLYNLEEVTRAQASLRKTTGPLPFIYPPSALPLLVPFALLPFWIAYWSWVAASVAVFWTASRRVASQWATVLAFASPNLILVLLLGQTTLFVGAALLWGLSLLRSKPFLAGFLIGVAAAIKPQSAIVAPIAFVAGRHWPAFAGAAVGGTSMILLSLPFGPALWIEWLRGLGSFNELIAYHGLHRLGATPAMGAEWLGLNLYGILLVQLVGIGVGAWVVWRGSRSDDMHLRLLCFFCGSFLVSPYAIRYELAMMAPVLASALLLGTVRGFLTALPIYALHVYAIVPALLISAGTALWGKPNAARPNREPGLAEEPAAERG